MLSKENGFTEKSFVPPQFLAFLCHTETFLAFFNLLPPSSSTEKKKKIKFLKKTDLTNST